MANKKPGRKKREFPTIPTMARLEPEIHKKLVEEAKANNFFKGGRPNVSAVLKMILEERYKSCLTTIYQYEKV